MITCEVMCCFECFYKACLELNLKEFEEECLDEDEGYGSAGEDEDEGYGSD